MGLLVLSLFSVTGCANLPFQEDAAADPYQKIADPPNIPFFARMGTSPLLEKIRRERLGLQTLGPRYVDLVDLDTVTPRGQRLHQIIIQFLHDGVLQPEGPDAQLALDKPLTRAQLAVWLARALHLPPRRRPIPYFRDVGMDRAEYGYIETVGQFNLMTGRKAPHGYLFEPDKQISRQELCVLYAHLSRQHRFADDLRAGDYRDLSPPEEEPVDNIARFRDFHRIDPRAQPYVAIAYEHRVLLNTFGLRAENLIRGGGLRPNAPILRREGLFFLHDLVTRHPMLATRIKEKW